MEQFLQKLFIAGLFICLLPQGVQSQSYDPVIQSHVDALDYDSLLLRLQQFEELGVKTSGTQALDDTRDWIVALYESWGYSDIVLDEFTHNGNPVQNIVVTRTGSLYPDTYLIVDGHYDTYGGPGVNDNGSGTACILEVARVMQDINTDYSIKFIHFTMEEVGLVGSTHYVENTVIPQNLDLRLVFNIDEVGGVAGETNNTITCERDEWAPNGNNAASAAFTDTLANLTELYSSLISDISYAYGSDYVPFMNHGYVVTGFYEYNESSVTHGPNDLLENMDPGYVFEVARAALAATLYFSGLQEVFSAVGTDEEPPVHFSVHPNPFYDHLQIMNHTAGPGKWILRNVLGEVVHSTLLQSESTLTLDKDLKPGVYFYEIVVDEKQQQSGKLIRN